MDKLPSFLDVSTLLQLLKKYHKFKYAIDEREDLDNTLVKVLKIPTEIDKIVKTSRIEFEKLLVMLNWKTDNKHVQENTVLLVKNVLKEINEYVLVLSKLELLFQQNESVKDLGNEKLVTEIVQQTYLIELLIENYISSVENLIKKTETDFILRFYSNMQYTHMTEVSAGSLVSPLFWDDIIIFLSKEQLLSLLTQMNKIRPNTNQNVNMQFVWVNIMSSIQQYIKIIHTGEISDISPSDLMSKLLEQGKNFIELNKSVKLI